MRSSPRLACSVCDIVSARGMRFCGQCGTSLESAVQDSGRRVAKARVGERRILTVMFCDLVGSTTLASALEPEDLRDVLLVFREACVSAVQSFGGTVGQYLGDGILAYFGYPKAREDDAQHALRAAVQARKAMAQVTSELNGRGIPLGRPIAIRIGVHSGLVVVADLGKGRNAETAAIVGQTTNIAARLQAAALPGTILASGATARLGGERFELTDMGARKLSGVTTPIQAFEVGEERHRREVLAFRSERAGLTLFLGRDKELRALRNSWQHVVSGSRASIVIEAEAGMGKSRLIDEFSGELSVAGFPTVMLHCSSDDQSSPYHPILSWIRCDLNLLGSGEPEATRTALRFALGEQAQARTELYIAALLDCSIAGEEREIAQAPRRRRRETINAILDLFNVRLASRGPHLLVFEDLHWADGSTLSVVNLLADYCPANWQVLMLLTSRVHLPLQVASIVATHELQRLPEADSRRLVRALVPTGATDVLVDMIVKRTDGIPLFTEEVSRLAFAHTEIGSSYERAVSNDIPLTLRGALLAQLDTLGHAKSIAQVASAIGRSFQARLLAAVLGENENGTTEAALSQLVRARFLDVHCAPDETGTYTFRHALLRDAAYDSMLADRRRALHGVIGRVLLASSPGLAQSRPEILANHFALAGLTREAAGYYELAARRAALCSTHVEAAEHCHAGLTQLESTSLPETAELEVRLRILLAAQITATRGNASPAVRDAFEKAREVAEVAGLQDWLGRAHRGLLTFYLVKGEIGAGYDISSRVMELAADEKETGARIQLYRPRGLTLLYMGRFTEARHQLRCVISLYKTTAHADQRFEYGSDSLVLARCHLGWVEWFIGDVGKATRECRSAVAIARKLEHPHSLAFALAFQACLYEFMGMVEAANGTAIELVQISEHHEYAYWSAWGRIILGWCTGILGETVEAGEDLLRRGLADYEMTGAGVLVPYANILLSDLVAPRDRSLAKQLQNIAREKAAAGQMGLWEVLLHRRRRQKRNWD